MHTDIKSAALPLADTIEKFLPADDNGWIVLDRSAIMNDTHDRHVVGWALLPGEAAPEWGFDGSGTVEEAALLLDADELSEEAYSATHGWTRVQAVVAQFAIEDDGSVTGSLVPWPATLAVGGLIGRWDHNENPDTTRFLDAQYARLHRADAVSTHAA